MDSIREATTEIMLSGTMEPVSEETGESSGFSLASFATSQQRNTALDESTYEAQNSAMQKAREAKRNLAKEMLIAAKCPINEVANYISVKLTSLKFQFNKFFLTLPRFLIRSVTSILYFNKKKV